MIRRLVTTVVVVLALLIAALGDGWSGQVQHPVNGPPSSTPKFYPCWANSTGNQVDTCSNGAIGLSKTISGTSYSFLAADCGTTVHFSSSLPVAATLPNNLPANCNIDVIQDGLGPVTFTPAAGALLRNSHGFNRTFGQYAAVGLHIGSNSNGLSAVYYMFGDGA